MTLQNLRYVIEVANCQSFSQAAKALFMTQSALSAAVKETEDELGIQIFHRTNRGVSLTLEGEDCLKYCKEIVERSDFLAARYQEKNPVKTSFSVSSQHLPFATRAFDELLSTVESGAFDIVMREIQTNIVLHDVSTDRSEIGVLTLVQEQLALLGKALYIHDLNFVEVARLNTYVFMRKLHPLAGRRELTLEDLKDYPFVTYDQEQVSGYYSEESLFFTSLKKTVHVSDRATKMAVIRSSDAFSIGVDLPNFNRDIYFRHSASELAAVPFADQPEPLSVGYLVKNGHALSRLGEKYLELLRKHIRELIIPTGQN